jgi:hypothetical protein
VRLLASISEYDQFLAADDFRRTDMLPPSGERWIITEALHQDIRVTLRDLTVANALRRTVPARVLVVTGTDDDWSGARFQAAGDGPVRPLVVGDRELPPRLPASGSTSAPR